VIHLKNGRTMEGEITRKTADTVQLRVRGGSMTFPMRVVARIEERARPQDAFAARMRRVDTTDPAALERLALWASSRGLGQESQNLNAQADGIRLQRRVDAVRGTRRAQDWVDVYRWAQHRRLSDEVRGWLLEQAEAIDADHQGLRIARRELAQAAEAAERAADARARAPEGYRARKRARIERYKREKAEAAEQARIARLEAQLAQQQARIDELERCDDRRVIRRRRRPRRGVSVGVIVPSDPCLEGTPGLIKATPLPQQPDPGQQPVSIRGR
jgi:hypothetical protein